MSAETIRDELDVELATTLYRGMLRIRRFEERVATLFEAGELPGFVHLSIGQESIAAGVVSALRADDFVTATHRGHGQIIAKGARFDAMVAELMGKATGYCRGKGGSMHIFDLSLGILGANGILGAGQPIAVGAGLGAKLRGTGAVCASFFGEGASAQGAVHEAMNTAAILSTPTIFVAEINGFAEMTPYGVHVGVPSLTARAPGYGIAAESVDGSDVLAVHAAATRAVAATRAGGGPFLLEVRTVRWGGHYEGDQQRYRDVDELAGRQASDPVAALESRLLAAGTERAALDQLDAAIGAELDAAVGYARESPPPEPESALEDVYVTPLPVGGGRR